jgi:16S rRNA G527 N7-methylase RsmG
MRINLPVLDRSPSSAQGIAAEIPQTSRLRLVEELERKARFLRALHAKMRPETDFLKVNADALLSRPVF